MQLGVPSSGHRQLIQVVSKFRPFDPRGPYAQSAGTLAIVELMQQTCPLIQHTRQKIALFEWWPNQLDFQTESYSRSQYKASRSPFPIEAITTVKSIIQKGRLANFIRPIIPWQRERQPADQSLRQYSSVNWTIITVSQNVFNPWLRKTELTKPNSILEAFFSY